MPDICGDLPGGLRDALPRSPVRQRAPFESGPSPDAVRRVLQAYSGRQLGAPLNAGATAQVYASLAAPARLISVTTEAAMSLSSSAWWVVQWRGRLSVTQSVPSA